MGRPPLPLGTNGSVTVCGYGVVYRARTRYRDFDGQTRWIERHGKTKGAARNALAEALRDRGRRYGTVQEIDRLTRFGVVLDLWLVQLEESELKANTKAGYRDSLKSVIRPALEHLQVHEVTTQQADRFFTATRLERNVSAARTARVVLTQVMDLVVRYGAADRNPIRDCGPIAGAKTGRKAARALTLDEAVGLRSGLAADALAVERDLPDLVDLLLATGERIGECLGVAWDAVDLQAGTVDVRATVVRVRGKGLVLQEAPKTEGSFRTLTLPTWAVAMLVRRRAADPDAVMVFEGSARTNGLRAPNKVHEHLKDALTLLGLDWVTTHTFRKTVATLMDEAGLSARAAADQLGHKDVSMTQNRYMGRRARATGAADVLEAINLEAINPAAATEESAELTESVAA